MSFVPIIAAVIAKQEEAIISYFEDRKAKSRESAVDIKDSEIRGFLPKHRHRLYFAKNKGERYWIDEELYGRYQKNKEKLMLIVFVIIIILIIAGLGAFWLERY